MSRNNEKATTNVLVKEGYQPAGRLERGYQPELQMAGTPEPPHVGSAAVVPSANAPTNPAPANGGALDPSSAGGPASI